MWAYPWGGQGFPLLFALNAAWLIDSDDGEVSRPRCLLVWFSGYLPATFFECCGASSRRPLHSHITPSPYCRTIHEPNPCRDLFCHLPTLADAFCATCRHLPKTTRHEANTCRKICRHLPKKLCHLPTLASASARLMYDSHTTPVALLPNGPVPFGPRTTGRSLPGIPVANGSPFGRSGAGSGAPLRCVGARSPGGTDPGV
mmetsp:Transcript_10101/g.17875  ORF Transcript_10101/g.17875 Transcript_10101/m.17875 type:complete len:201 (+) Transcript_10101:1623-2225(+)